MNDTLIAPNVNHDADLDSDAAMPLDAPDADALAAYVDWLIATDDPGHATEPTPVEALGPAPAPSWWETAEHDPELDDVRYEPTEPEPFALPVGGQRDPRRRVSSRVSDHDQPWYGGSRTD